jgi:formylglycine-generating enzyme required for sulfatase activity
MAALFATPAHAQPDPSGIDFVTVGAPGNAAWEGPGFNNGKGSVSYEFKMGQYEVTTAQWAEFFNAALDRPTTDRIPFVSAPQVWGAQSTTPQAPGGRRWSVPTGNEMRAVGGITWRTAAVFCNWLHNGKGTSRAAFLSGAYNVSTFGGQGGGFLDQLTRSPGAQYWIPSTDEWLKAAHYDPSKQNSDGSLGGWWQYSNGSDTTYAYGPPGTLVRADGDPRPDPNGVLATANAGWDAGRFPGQNAQSVRLGSYATTNPWGLFDVAGATSEWTEGYFQIQGEPIPRERALDGSSWLVFVRPSVTDQTQYLAGSYDPFVQFSDFGFRVATVPGPTGLGFAILVSSSLAFRGRRRQVSSN